MGGDDHRCEWRDRAEALEAELAQIEATLEKLQRHQFGARSEKMWRRGDTFSAGAVAAGDGTT